MGLGGNSPVARNQPEAQVNCKSQMYFTYLMTQTSRYAQDKCYVLTGFLICVDTLKLLGWGFVKESDFELYDGLFC